MTFYIVYILWLGIGIKCFSVSGLMTPQVGIISAPCSIQIVTWIININYKSIDRHRMHIWFSVCH